MTVPMWAPFLSLAAVCAVLPRPAWTHALRCRLLGHAWYVSDPDCFFWRCRRCKATNPSGAAS